MTQVKWSLREAKQVVTTMHVLVLITTAVKGIFGSLSDDTKLQESISKHLSLHMLLHLHVSFRFFQYITFGIIEFLAIN